MSQTFERLSSGLRINRASDDAAGLAISSILRNDGRVFGQALRNINDAQSALSIAEGALTDLSSVTMRLRELATQAANGTFTVTQRRALDDEADALVSEYNRIAGTTEFNGLKLLDGSFSRMRIQMGYGVDGSLDMGLSASFARNVGSGTYNRIMSESTITLNSQTSVAADFNGDGKVDVLTRTSAGGSMMLLRGKGDGTFDTSSTFTIAGNSAFYASDFNNDGKLDIAVVAGSGNLSVALGNGDGTFGTATVLNMGTGAFLSAAVGDVNGDGRTDLVSANGAGGIAIRYGNGDGTFAAVQSIGSGLSNTTNVALGDVNGDGALDILGSSNGGYLLLNSGSGAFSQGSSLGLGVVNFLHDADDDGFADIISIVGGGVNFYKSRGNGSFAASVNSASTFSSAPIMADLNGDGLKDIIGSGAGVSEIMLANGDGTYRAGTNLSYGISVSAPAVGDFDGDGAADIGVITIGGTTKYRTYLANAQRTSTMQALNLNSRASALESSVYIDAALERIGKELGDLGASQRRLESAYNTLSAARENSAAAEGRISNADIASESARMLREQILQQSTAAVLAQANQQPALVLQLLAA